MTRKSTAWGYLSIAEDIIGQIDSGTLRPGDALPTRLALAARYAVSEATVANALRHLAAAGYTVGQQGKAVTVVGRAADAS